MYSYIEVLEWIFEFGCFKYRARNHLLGGTVVKYICICNIRVGGWMWRLFRQMSCVWWFYAVCFYPWWICNSKGTTTKGLINYSYIPPNSILYECIFWSHRTYKELYTHTRRTQIFKFLSSNKGSVFAMLTQKILRLHTHIHTHMRHAYTISNGINFTTSIHIIY